MRLIDADALRDTIHIHHYILRDQHNSFDTGMFTCGIDYAIDEQPTIDPFKHGHWIKNYEDNSIECSFCKDELHFEKCVEDIDPVDDCELRFCPFCGAKMDEEVTEE